MWEETLIVGIHGGTLLNPDPIKGYQDTTSYITLGYLVNYDWEDTTKFKGVIAESWSLKYKPDGTPYVEFKIRKDLKWNDGTEIDAPGCKKALDNLAKTEPRYKAARRDATFQSVEAPDKYTLNLICNNKFGYVGTLGFQSLYFGGIVSPNGREKYGEGLKVKGFAPYDTVEFITNEKAVMKKNHDYPWADHFKFETVVLRLFADSSSLRLALEKGDIDIAIQGLSKNDLKDLEKKPGFEVQWIQSAPRTLLLYHGAPEFNNIKVRQAIAEVIDQKEIVEATSPMTPPQYNLIKPRFKYYYNDEPWLKRYGKHDVEKAKRLMAEGGYPNGFKMELWFCDSNQDIEGESHLATVLKEQLARIGIDVTLRSTQKPVYMEKRRTPGLMPMALQGWQEDYPDADANMEWLFASQHAYGKNVIGFNEEIHPDLVKKSRALLAAEREVWDPAKEPNPERKEIFDQLHEMNAEHVLAIPLYCEVKGAASRDWLKGFKVAPIAMLRMPLNTYGFEWDVYKKAPPGMF
jgi:peptide/nickel transport system substrate-binding protein